MSKNSAEFEEFFNQKIQEVWDGVVSYCNQTISNAEFYGIQFMHIQDPNVHKFLKTLDKLVLPLLDELVNECEFSPENGMRMANIKTYSLHLREVSLALQKEDVELFESAIEKLANEARL